MSAVIMQRDDGKARAVLYGAAAYEARSEGELDQRLIVPSSHGGMDVTAGGRSREAACREGIEKVFETVSSCRMPSTSSSVTPCGSIA
jgi:hypothetical protein